MKKTEKEVMDELVFPALAYAKKFGHISISRVEILAYGGKNAWQVWREHFIMEFLGTGIGGYSGIKTRWTPKPSSLVLAGKLDINTALTYLNKFAWRVLNVEYHKEQKKLNTEFGQTLSKDYPFNEKFTYFKQQDVKFSRMDTEFWTWRERIDGKNLTTTEKEKSK